MSLFTSRHAEKNPQRGSTRCTTQRNTVRAQRDARTRSFHLRDASNGEKMSTYSLSNELVATKLRLLVWIRFISKKLNLQLGINLIFCRFLFSRILRDCSWMATLVVAGVYLGCDLGEISASVMLSRSHRFHTEMCLFNRSLKRWVLVHFLSTQVKCTLFSFHHYLRERSEHTFQQEIRERVKMNEWFFVYSFEG